MFYCIYKDEHVYYGKTLKSAYDACVAAQGEIGTDDLRFVEGEAVQVEFRVETTEVVTEITKVTTK